MTAGDVEVIGIEAGGQRRILVHTNGPRSQ
jgi:hypothetical protein